MRQRTRARELSLQFLFSLEVQGPDGVDGLDSFLKDSGAARPVKEFVGQAIRGVIADQHTIDDLIAQTAQKWALQRIANVDRNILRIAVWELLRCPETPVGVVINEAVELGKRYSTAQSGGFINGLLDAIVDKLGRKPAAHSRSASAESGTAPTLADDDAQTPPP